MLMPMVQQVISKCQTEHKLWDQTLYNGPQVLIIDGPVYNSSMLNIARSISRMLQYNYPGIESTVINAMNSPGIDFVTYRILNNCNSDLVSIVCGADVKLLQKKLKSHSFLGKIKTVLLYENVDSFFKTNVVSMLKSTELAHKEEEDLDKIYNIINGYAGYFNITRTLRYTTLFAHSINDLNKIDENYLQKYSFLPTSNSSYYFVSRLRKLIASVRKTSFSKWVYFSPKYKYSYSFNIENRSADSIASELLARLSSPNLYTPFQIFGLVDLPHLSG